MSVERILFASSEAYPLIKTGGLADVSSSLPAAIKALDKDIRLILPAYRSIIDSAAGPWQTIAHIEIPGAHHKVEILEGLLPGTEVLTWLVYAPYYFDRDGGPYSDAAGHEWPDNPQRFAAFCHAIISIALAQADGISWQPDVIHCNDWQTGLVPALLADKPDRPATVFTIHNLAYQGLFPRQTFTELQLPENLWTMHGLEFHKQASFIKGGLVYSDILTTVSPTYAHEITTEAFGCGLAALLSSRQDRLFGILNGVDYEQWDPAQDPHLASPYSIGDLSAKIANKEAIQAFFGLPVDPKIPLAGMIARLAHQKGLDMLLDIIDTVLDQSLQIIVLGSGDKTLEAALLKTRERFPEQIGVHIGYHEGLSHQIEGGADMFLMPSRYEPCGLNQIYSLRYGTVPVVHRTGGLADTVIDTTADTLANGTATGFVFDAPNAKALGTCINRAVALYQDTSTWQQVVITGMKQDFSWHNSAQSYQQLYEDACAFSTLTPTPPITH